MARLGVGRLLPTSFWSALPEPAAGQFQALATSPRGWRNSRDESASLPALLRQAREPTDLGSSPLVVLTADEHESDAAWNAAQERMAALSTDSSHRLGDASHAELLDEEHGAALSTEAIDDVVRAARSGAPLSPD